MVRVLVTGANGFIGQSLFSALTVNGYLARGTVRAQSIISAKSLEGRDIVIVNDIGPDTDWSAALRGVDVVVHLAGRAHIMKETAENPLEAFRTVNTKGTERLALMAAQNRVKRFIYISSIGVNGEQSAQRPFTEEDIPCPARPYAISKWEAEKKLMDIARRSGLEIVILRLPLVYGRGVKGNFQKLLNYVDRGWPLPFAGIDNKRSLVGLDNVVDAILLTIRGTAAAGNLFLLSDGEDVSTAELICHIAQAMNKKARFFAIPRYLFSFALNRIPALRQKVTQLTSSLLIDSSKFKKTMNWKPRYGVRDGIKDMVSDYLARRSGFVSEKSV